MIIIHYSTLQSRAYREKACVQLFQQQNNSNTKLRETLNTSLVN